MIILAADTKCPRMALKYITPKTPRGSGLSVARYITLHMQEGANYSLCNLFCWRFHYQSYLFMFQREEAIRKNHIVTTGGEGVADTWKVERPKSLDLLQDTSYFRAKTMHQRPSTYDRINHVVEGYDQKLHRDDREHAKSRGLKVNSEEVRVTVPVLSSSTYGHPKYPALDLSDRKHVRVEICKKDFLRLGGTNIGNTD